MFFGSGINNFGVQEILQALTDWAPPPQPRDGGERIVHPTEAPFSGFVFKIQANMDPKHRDRIAFFRVCSGRYTPAMKVRHLRLGREMKLGNVMTFMANERVRSEDAVAGDIIGIHNHGQLHIGDTLTESEALDFKGIPYFAPEMFRVARPLMNVPFGWYFDLWRGHWKPPFFGSVRKAVFWCGQESAKAKISPPNRHRMTSLLLSMETLSVAGIGYLTVPVGRTSSAANLDNGARVASPASTTAALIASRRKPRRPVSQSPPQWEVFVGSDMVRRAKVDGRGRPSGVPAEPLTRW